jgi:serine/threonine-protein kinase HipA
MDPEGRWSLAPAFDVTYSYNPDGAWTSVHQMSVNGKRDGFEFGDFEACAKSALLKRGRARAILDEVVSAVKRWPEFAEEAKVAPAWRDAIRRTHRLEFSAAPGDGPR